MDALERRDERWREVTGTPPSGGVGDGTYYYKVKFMCDGDEVVLDPRMDVP